MQNDAFSSIFFDETWWDRQLTFIAFYLKGHQKYYFLNFLLSKNSEIHGAVCANKNSLKLKIKKVTFPLIFFDVLLLHLLISNIGKSEANSENVKANSENVKTN